MPKILSSHSLEFSQRLYQRLLAAYPRRHREEYGGAMTQLFRDQCRDAWEAGRTWGLAALWLRTVPDLVKTSFIERCSNFNPGKFMSEKLNAFFSPHSTPGSAFFKVFIVAFLLVCSAAVAITILLPDTYAATVRIKVEPEPMANTTSGSGGLSQDQPYDPYFLQTTFEMIQSQVVLSNVVNALKLNVEWGKKHYAGRTLTTQETMEILKRRMDLKTVRNTKLISITVYSEDKFECANLANAVAGSYRDYRQNSRQLLAESELRGLGAKLNESDQEIVQTQTELGALAQKLQVVDNQELSVAELAQNTGPTSVRTAENQPYWDKKEKLAQLRDLNKALVAKVEMAKLDTKLGRAWVEMVDFAEPGFAPVRPNKTLDIFVGAMAGVMLGGVAGLIAAVIVLRSARRDSKSAMGV